MKNKVSARLLEARKARNVVEKNTLQGVLSKLQNEEIALKRELKDDEAIAIIKNERKQLNEALAMAKDAGREDLVAKLESQVTLIEGLLPAMLSESEIKDIVDAKGAAKGMNIGQLMGMIMKDHKSEVDGAVVKKVIDENYM